ncbi:hypothetical protein SAMN05518682_0412 [Cellulosimicrobium aquatile]|uniref:Uncharacterized protein n=1 Tax=Cellulosimicrobium aquatile TaxID=1612203 RepID=A0A1N6NEP7_9MICO|nr:MULTISPECIES: hypothetical protein [Cellulosimicrobium]MCM3533472.1 hypothetical protein [Cellulosimicrobium funkei]MDQ8041232.1 hypothetical protein [Cellulosimicrobium sp. XJ-DQ-B-000]SIP90466.1 hypothetical protein SAMN05518682_0412 [Cellulosimicrobium aquatile]
MSSEQSRVPDGTTPDPSAAPDAVVPDAARPEAGSEAAEPGGAEPEAAGPGTRADETPGAVSDDAASAGGEEVEIESVVDPATVRRAPRYRAFFTVGILLGTVLGLGIGGAWLQSPAAAPVFKPGVYFTVILVTCAALGAAVAGVWAVVADRRSLRGRR